MAILFLSLAENTMLNHAVGSGSDSDDPPVSIPSLKDALVETRVAISGVETAAFFRDSGNDTPPITLLQGASRRAVRDWLPDDPGN